MNNYLWLDQKAAGLPEPSTEVPYYDLTTDHRGRHRIEMTRGPYKGEVYFATLEEGESIEMFLTEILGPGWKGN